MLLYGEFAGSFDFARFRVQVPTNGLSAARKLPTIVISTRRRKATRCIHSPHFCLSNPIIRPCQAPLVPAIDVKTIPKPVINSARTLNLSLDVVPRAYPKVFGQPAVFVGAQFDRPNQPHLGWG